MKIGRLASIYDGLANLVFGAKWNAIQLNASADLNGHDHVLILGGGTGQILDQLVDCELTFVELSASMIQKAKMRPNTEKVDWVNQDFLTWHTTKKFDAVYCPFFLDVFPEVELNRVLDKIGTCMKPGGKFYVLDFQRGNRFQQMLTILMILFFKMVSGLKSDGLLDIDQHIRKCNFKLQKEKVFYGHWIFYRSYVMSS